MNGIIYLLVIGLFTLDWLAFVMGVLGRIATWLPEFLSLTVMVVVAVLIARGHEVAMPYRYALWIVTFLILVVGWALLNGVAAGTLIVGLRSYLKYLPFFLLPMVYQFAPVQMRRQFLLLLALSVIQLPVALYQRFVAYADLNTGDVIGGTLGAHTSGVLSVYLCCAIALTVAFYVKGRIRLRLLLPMLAILATPTMLNETKVTLLLLPAALLGPVILGGKTGRDLRKSLALSVCGVMLILAFVQVYDVLKGNEQSSIVEFFTDEKKVQQYLYKGGDPRLMDTIGRMDAIIHAVTHLRRDGNFLLGVGAGNASPSFSEKLIGEYYKKYQYLTPTKTSMSKVLWELGVVGVIVFGAFFAMVAMDSYRLARRDDFIGAFGLGWVLVTGFVAMSFVYFKTIDTNLVVYLYWYFSGHIVAETYRARAVAAREFVPHGLRVPSRG